MVKIDEVPPSVADVNTGGVGGLLTSAVFDPEPFSEFIINSGKEEMITFFLRSNIFFLSNTDLKPLLKFSVSLSERTCAFVKEVLGKRIFNVVSLYQLFRSMERQFSRMMSDMVFFI